MAYAAFEDATLRKVFAVALDPATAAPSASPPIVHLSELEQASPSHFAAYPHLSQPFLTDTCSNTLEPHRNCARRLAVPPLSSLPTP